MIETNTFNGTSVSQSDYGTQQLVSWIASFYAMLLLLVSGPSCLYNF